MARSSARERAGSLTPPAFDCDLQALRKVSQRILGDPVHLHDEVHVWSGRHPGTADRTDHVALRDRVPRGNPRYLGHMSIEGLEPVTMVDLHVVAQPTVTPTGVLDRAAVCGQERRIGVRRQVDAVVEVTADRRIPGLEPEGAAAEGLREDPGLERIVERPSGRHRGSSPSRGCRSGRDPRRADRRARGTSR